MKQHITKIIIAAMLLFVQEIHAQRCEIDFKADSSMREMLTNAAASSNLSIMDSAILMYSNSNQDFQTDLFRVEYDQDNNLNTTYLPLKEWVDLLTAKETLKKPLYDSIMNKMDSTVLNRSLYRVKEFETLFQPRYTAITGEQTDPEENPNFYYNCVPYYDKIKLVIDKQPLDLNESVIKFFDLQFSSPLEKKVFLSSHDFSFYKEYFLTLRKYFENKIFMIMVRGAIGNYDMNLKRFPYIFSLQNKYFTDKGFNLLRKVYFPLVKTEKKPIDNDIQEAFYFPITSESDALSVEKYGAAIFFFKLTGVSSTTGDGENMSVTAGNTRFVVIVPSNFPRIYYTKLFVKSTSTATPTPVKK